MIFNTQLKWVFPIAIAWLLTTVSVWSQDRDNAQDVDTGGEQAIILKTVPRPAPTFLYTASAETNTFIGIDAVRHETTLDVRIVQGKPGTITLELKGPGDIESVEGEPLIAWSVRNQDGSRFLDLVLQNDASQFSGRLVMSAKRSQRDRVLDLGHLAPGKAVGFNSIVNLEFVKSVTGQIVTADGFAPLASDLPNSKTKQVQTSTGGRLTLELNRKVDRDPVTFVDAQLVGELEEGKQSIAFRLTARAQVNSAGATLPVLSGLAAIAELPTKNDFQLRLLTSNQEPAYELIFPTTGEFEVDLSFVAPIRIENGWQGVQFKVATSTVMPIEMKGFSPDLNYQSHDGTTVPTFSGNQWNAFLPASGVVQMRWKDARAAGESKLFFTTNAQIESIVGPGLMRQNHRVEYQILQGELDILEIALTGPGEVLDVQGDNIVGWEVAAAQDDRQLTIRLSQPISGRNSFEIRTQTPLDAFPVKVQCLVLKPQNALRHSGHLRLSNTGSVRIEPTDMSGLTQLAPEHFPGSPLSARQLFVYRFPSASYDYSVVADRIQPEVNVQQLLVYELTETDRVLSADIELDIREAAIREWNVLVPEDYSIVSVVGASVADYVVASESVDGMRNVKVIFSQDVEGRQLISARMEKSEPAVEGAWSLPRVEHVSAKSVRGDIGVVGAPGYRIAVDASEFLVDKPLSTFPKPTPNLQQAFRIRQREWSASVIIEALQRSIQSDVFHLISLSQGSVYGNALMNFFVTGAPTSEWQIHVPSELGNLTVDGQDIRTWRRDADTLFVSLHQPVMGPYTLLLTFEQKPEEANNTFPAAEIAAIGVQGDRGYIQVVSPMQVEIEPISASEELLVLDPLELPAEFRLLSTAPSLGTWQYTQRPFDLRLKVNWFEPGTTATQVVEFSEANSRVSTDGELVTDVVYFVKSRGQRTLRLQLPPEPVRLWSIRVDGAAVTARRSGDETLIPLPGNADPNHPVEVSLRLGKPAENVGATTLALPIVFAPVLKTQWNVDGDENHVIVPAGGPAAPTRPVLWPRGFDWLAGEGLVPLLIIAGLGALASLIVRNGSLSSQLLAVVCSGLALALSLWAGWDAWENASLPSAIQMSLPVLSAGELVTMRVENTPLWQARISWPGLGLFAGGLLIIAASSQLSRRSQTLARFAGCIAALAGLALLPNGAAWMFLLVALLLTFLQFFPTTRVWLKELSNMTQKENTGTSSPAESDSFQGGPGGEGNGPGVVTSLIAWVAIGFASAGGQSANAVEVLPDFRSADSIVQSWNLDASDSKLRASGSMTLTGKPGDQFLLLKSPATLTQFEGKGLRISKAQSPSGESCYVITVPYAEDAESADLNSDTGEESPAQETEDATNEADSGNASQQPKTYAIEFEYQVEAVRPVEGIQVLTGPATLRTIELSFDDAGWNVLCSTAARIQTLPAEKSTKASLLLRAGDATIFLQPLARDLSNEETKFFVEAAHIFTAGPGVIDGRHRLDIHTSQGRVQELVVSVPSGLTVSDVSGPITTWRYDADTSKLQIATEPTVDPNFQVSVQTQRALDPLPSELTVAPPRVENGSSEVGLIAIAFGTDAQPEKVESETFSQVNIGDFDESLIQEASAVVHRVFRYGSDQGEISVRVAPVSPEIRVVSRQVLSLGDERVVLSVNFAVEITRTGLFQLSFMLPTGLEIESLSGASLHHWSEVAENGERKIVLHLNGKTQGTQNFALTLTGPAPEDTAEWEVPRFALNEAQRQYGDLSIQPITGIRLRAVSRQNVSETDPRSLGSQQQGGLAFRLLQKDWNLTIGIEKLEPWVTGQILHDIILREGQTRSTIFADFQIQNASIRTLTVRMPISNPEELNTIRASGTAVSDFVRLDPESDLWQLKLKRRVIGRVQFQIEFERRGDRPNNTERLSPIEFPSARQTAYYYALRVGGRLEIEPANLTQGWQQADWNTVPSNLRQGGNQNAPAVSLRALDPVAPLAVQVLRHSLAESLKLRVASGEITTVLSPNGDQLTEVELDMEVIQRSSLNVTLPNGAELFNIFVNGESVHSVRQENSFRGWQFYILPGIDDQTATVRFVYLLTGDGLKRLSLESPQLDVPLENVTWQVVAPDGYELVNADGNLELVGTDSNQSYDRESYLSKISGRREDQANQAAQLLEQASELLQAGEQTKARRALSNVANRYALDAASNEDARVQLENLQTQQAIVGLNTRRQRLYLDNSLSGLAFSENEQLRQAAVTNPILRQEELNFRPQELSQLLAGNSVADNAVLQQIAARLVTHQRTTEPAPQAITISLPEEGTTYEFSRAVQVTEGAPLELNLDFNSRFSLLPWQWLIVSALIVAIAFSLSRASIQTPAEAS